MEIENSNKVNKRVYFCRSGDGDPLLSLNKRVVRSFGLLDRWDRYTLHFVLGRSKTFCCSLSSWHDRTD